MKEIGFMKEHKKLQNKVIWLIIGGVILVGIIVAIALSLINHQPKGANDQIAEDNTQDSEAADEVSEVPETEVLRRRLIFRHLRISQLPLFRAVIVRLDSDD